MKKVLTSENKMVRFVVSAFGSKMLLLRILKIKRISALELV